MRERNAMMDFERHEVRYRAAGRSVVIPFRTYDATSDARVSAVRLARGGGERKCRNACGDRYHC
jgi:hypothetical protein